MTAARPRIFDRVLLAGVGLIGGSFGMALRRKGLVGEVVGFGRSLENLETALERGAIDRFERDPLRAAEDCDAIVFGVPVQSIEAVATSLVASARAEAVLSDVGSVKGPVVDALESVARDPSRVVGAHPIAGTENSGAAHAFAELFEGARCILTPTERTDRAALTAVQTLWEAVGARVEVMPAAVHDRILAEVSHLPHAVAFALVAAISESVEGFDPLALCGGGLRDTTRIAASDPVMWRDIFLDNRAEVLGSLDRFESELRRLRDAVERADGAAIEATIATVRQRRRGLDG